jgi:septum formation protein
MDLKHNLILGSQSPRRKRIFKMLGLSFQCKSPDFQEEVPQAILKKHLTRIPESFAVQKALSISADGKNDLVLSYDTAVFYQGSILGKPDNGEHAFQMLKLLNGKSHQVITGIALARDGRIICSGKETTEVTFAQVKREILQQYAFSREPRDKAGSYAIQGKGALLVKRIDGCYYNVMGVPVQTTLKFLKPYFSD